MADSPLVVRAHAKINLVFEVLGRRSDGLHEVRTVLQAITLADRLLFWPAERITLRCRGMDVSEDNLILRAARLLQIRTGVRAGCAIRCEKRIPVAAGLGGGSADAGVTLRVLNQLWGAGLSEPDLLHLAAELGADVPFSVVEGTVVASGTGRTLHALPDAPPRWVVLVPLGADSPTKTAVMYARLEIADFGDGAATERLAAAIGMGGFDDSAVGSAFSGPASRRWSATRQALLALAAAGVDAASVSGAGPSVFGVCGSRSRALAGLRRLRSEGLPARLDRFVGRAPGPEAPASRLDFGLPSSIP